MSFKDLGQIFKIQPIRLPIRGKTYEFPGSVSGRTGLLLHRMTEIAEKATRGQDPEDVAPSLEDDLLDDVEAVELRRELLGDAEKQMLDDDVPWPYIDHVFKTLIVWHQFGEEVAEKVWEDVPGAPKAPQDRKSPQGTSGSGSTTKRQASSRSTSRSTKASPGDDSSSTGT